MCSISLGFGGTPNRNDDEFQKMIIARNGYKSANSYSTLSAIAKKSGALAAPEIF